MTASERFADGLLAIPRMVAVREAAGRAVGEWVPMDAVAVGLRYPEEVAHAVTVPDAHQAAIQAAELTARLSEAEARDIGYVSRKSSEANLLRDIFGSLFRPVTIDPSWRTPTVVNLANAIYDNRAFDCLPLLAGALEELGCRDAQILTHCREPGPHVRGCWVVDLVLGKN